MGNAGDATNTMGPFRPARRRCSRFARLGQLAATISPRAGRGGDFTLQWCIISEALNRSLHRSGAHAMAASYRDLSGPVSLHHTSSPRATIVIRRSPAPGVHTRDGNLLPRVGVTVAGVRQACLRRRNIE